MFEMAVCRLVAPFGVAPIAAAETAIHACTSPFLRCSRTSASAGCWYYARAGDRGVRPYRRDQGEERARSLAESFLVGACGRRMIGQIVGASDVDGIFVKDRP